MPQVHRSAETHPVEDATPTSAASILLRIFWMLGGYIVLAVCALFIATNKEALFSAKDPVFWVVAGLMVWARYVDIARYHGTTSDGQPATLANWRGYAMVVVAVAGVTWAAAHAVAYFG
jgi:hypothetical protein